MKDFKEWAIFIVAVLVILAAVNRVTFLKTFVTPN